MKMLTTKLLAAAIAAGTALVTPAAITGQWEFNGSLTSAVGQPIDYYDGAAGVTAAQTRFGTTTSFGIPDINGEPAQVMAFSTNLPAMGYTVPHGIAASENAFLANEWTVVMDVLFPQSSTGQWRALLQSNTENPSNDDAEFYLNQSNGLGIDGIYAGNVAANTWVRLALSAQATETGITISKFINGIKVGENSGGLDGRFALTPDSFFLLFTDGYAQGEYTQPGYINSLQVQNGAMPAAYIAALGGPSASGIPMAALSRPFVASVTPVADNNASPQQAYEAIIENAQTQLNPSSVVLKLNNQAVNATVAPAGTNTAIRFSSSQLFSPGSTNVWELVFADNSSPAALTTNRVTITVANYTDLKLPTPIFFENFESTAEGSLPTGWTNLSFTEVSNPEFDLFNLDSASYANWVVVDSQRFKSNFLSYSSVEISDYQRVLAFDPIYVVNGQVVTNLASGKFVFGNSGYRNGASQAVYLFTPDINLTGKNNIQLVFHSLWEQNQDSFAAVEYSTDRGQTWKPIIYMIATSDIVRSADGAVDAVGTFSAEHTDVARYIDANGVEVGGTYGAFVAAPVTAALAPFISGRVDDGLTESKRVETFSLPGAANQATVRFRFAHTGVDSWYWGLDNVGVYSIEVIDPPSIAAQPIGFTKGAGEPATLSVTAGGTAPLAYQWFLNNQSITRGTNAALNFTSLTTGDAGQYYVQVSNAGGSTNSATVTVTVTVPQPAIAGVWQFEGNLNPSLGGGSLAVATTETQSALTFGTTDGTAVPHIAGQPAQFAKVAALPAGAHGLLLTMPTMPNGSGDYLNRYTMVWDVLVPGAIGWTPFFNTAPDASGGNDADFYVDDTGRLGIGALGYSPANTIQADQWYRVAFVADLAAGEVTYYLNGQEVYKRTGAAMVDGRFALYTGTHAGPDVLLFSEPSGGYNHDILVSSFGFIDQALTPVAIQQLGAPSVAGVSFGLRVSAVLEGANIRLSWTGATGTVKLQKTTSLAPANWQDVTVPQGATSVLEPTSGGMAFYRAVQQ